MYPSLTLSASYGRGGFDWSTFTSPAGLIWGVGASLTQPLFHGGALVARKHQYEATYAAAVAQYKQTVLSAFQNVADTLASLDEDANTLAQTQRAATAARSLHGDTESRYKLGAMPFYATLTAGQQYQSAEVQYVRARAARLADAAALLDSMGDLPPKTARGGSGAGSTRKNGAATGDDTAAIRNGDTVIRDATAAEPSPAQASIRP